MPPRKSSDCKPQISQVSPHAAIPGGELQIHGTGFARTDRPRVTIGDVGAPVVVGSDSFVIARVPDGATAGELVIESDGQTSGAWACDIGVQIADSLHPVANPAVDSAGNIYTTFSGSRGQKVPVAVFKIDLNFGMKPFINELMNATALAFDPQGMLYISSRHDGMVYQATPTGNMSVFVEGMGVATGLAFDREQNLYVGDRSGTIFKIGPNRQIFVFPLDNVHPAQPVFLAIASPQAGILVPEAVKLVVFGPVGGSQVHSAAKFLGEYESVAHIDINFA